MRRLTPALLALLVLTAGCANFLPWSHSDSNHQLTTDQMASSHPPGANGQWIFDAKQLVAAHEAALDGTNYRMHVDVRSNRSVGLNVWGNRTLTAYVGGGHTLIKGYGGRLGERNLTGYSSDDMVAYCREKDDVCHYRDEPGSLRQMPMEKASRIQSILAGSDFVANGTTTRNGTTLYRYETDGNTALSSLRTISATILVDEDGLIHDFSGEVLTTDHFRSEFDYRFSVVSRPPDEPNWIESLPRVKYRVNATEITLEHVHGGERIPAGTNVSLRLENDTVFPRTTMQLPKSLGDGDVAHLTATVTKDPESGNYRAVGNVTINRPPTSDSEMNYSNWDVEINVRTDQWHMSLWNPEKSALKKSTNSSESTTTYEV